MRSYARTNTAVRPRCSCFAGLGTGLNLQRPCCYRLSSTYIHNKVIDECQTTRSRACASVEGTCESIGAYSSHFFYYYYQIIVRPVIPDLNRNLFLQKATELKHNAFKKTELHLRKKIYAGRAA